MTEVDATTATAAMAPARPWPSVPADGPLAVALPVGVEPPTDSTWVIVKPGTGGRTAIGDRVEVSYEMYSWSTGEVVESTEDDLAGPLPIVLGDQHVPRVVEAAILGQPVGSRIMVVFEANLPDLPSYFDHTDAYVLALEITGNEPQSG